ncbi:GRASP protein [Schizosaccharomyces cryophilus OY26]|uniref:GRASP protein n=1 Tax=Schizosaccharomyces cryophilus (strain OY26 / ATCC MYA-4695 / CBS 11777 / NBRC 106824 / NRRL Y48691) TaxID=653667 RepID=S9XAK9_SCHCR|nr:GRASP protein [Schizosaccharomyces cryophilus OY26]EPY54187.1 GRASP protein [Schizosaccharomyces cryophilus OY26]
MFGGLKSFLKETSETLTGIHLDSSENYGFRVLKIQDNSKAADAGIESYYDFITAINGILLNGDPLMFCSLLRDSSPEATLEVFSLKGQITRKVQIDVSNVDDDKLGMTLQWASIHLAVDAVWHILNVIENSPIAQAKVIPYQDYIVGTPEGMMMGEKALADLIETHLNRPLRLYIYNQYQDTTRQITIVPNRNWGGDGAIGCGVGHGALHRLPASLSGPPPQPGDVAFSNPLLQPADYPETVTHSEETANAFPSPPTLQNDPSPKANLEGEIPIPHYQRHKKHGRNAIQDSAIQSYLEEEELLSKQLDHKVHNPVMDANASNTLPPPPSAADQSSNE